ncbi:MAG: alkaline phosphatase family protein [Candidatus Omnitrophica bacterium]|nr:alkaline phosphatase family protein [Candidatus Omnitrophota bacterium]
MSDKKVFVIGLDCLAPKLAFDKYISDMPTLSELLKRSTWGPMTSTIPPITCPAWACMTTSKEPGELGIYGFRNRVDHSYERLAIATSYAVKEKAIWDIIGEKGKKSIVVAVPPSYPPKKINGCMVGCFLSPDIDSDYTFPKELAKDIKNNVGQYLIDVRDFRTNDKKRLLKEIYDLTKNRFDTAVYLMQNKPWDFFMFVDMGPDRFHHGFWSYCDPEHNKYKKDNEFKDEMRKYYAFIDTQIKRILDKLDNNTVLCIVSDHGAKKIDGCFCINEWLIQKGYLKLKENPKEITKLNPSMIDWENTSAWGEGGYYGRIFFNVKGRETQGLIPKTKLKEFSGKLIKDLENIKYKNSEAKKTIVYEPKQLYKKTNGVAPDLLVFFGDLLWRSAGSVGIGDIYTFENDTGPDDANHDWQGVFVMYDPSERQAASGKKQEVSIYDFAPTVLDKMGFKVPKGMKGKVLG